jgi:hypothetical protein
MIAHVVLFRPKRDLSPAARRALVDALTSAAGIPSIQRFRIGRRVRHGLPGYEQAMPVDYEYVVLIEFADADALRAYLLDPSHVALGRHFTESAASALAYDYEIGEVDAARELLKEGPE